MKRLYPVTCFSVMLLLSSVAAKAEPIEIKDVKTNLSSGFSHYLSENAAESPESVFAKKSEFTSLPDGVPNLGLSSDPHWFLFSL
ncbi:MAG: hypothetical protein VX210_04730, partial [Myxococcota bacterium]|nr:hypothetical protein [Myxococcota bacterium]